MVSIGTTDLVLWILVEPVNALLIVKLLDHSRY
jgi:hypothetical protein